MKDEGRLAAPGFITAVCGEAASSGGRGGDKPREVPTMDEQAVHQYLVESFAEVETTQAYGYTFYFYRDDHTLPFATLIAADNEHDRVSKLDRPGVFRLNVGVGKQSFQQLFGADEPRGEAYDYTVLDRLMPHPEYAAQSFLCVLSPSPATFEQLRPLLAEAYDLAVKRYRRRHPAA